MEEYFLLLDIQRQNENRKQNLILFRRRLRDQNNPFELPENEFRRVYRQAIKNSIQFFIF